MSGPNFLSKITGTVTDHEEDMAVSIQAHLSQLLNTRREMAPHLAHYGLPDIHHVYYSLPYSLNRLAEEIKQTVTHYEPRLREVEVKLVSTSAETFHATFRISGEVAEGSKVSRLTFETEVLRDGRANTSLVTQYG